MKATRYIAAALAAMSLFLGAAPAFAQVYYPTTAPYYPPQYTCPQLTYNLYRGLYDANTGGQVSMLQQYLATRYSQSVTGFYGAITTANVAQFQREQNVYPITGGVGPLTRAAIARTCSGGGVSSNTFMLNYPFTLSQGQSVTQQNGQLSVTLAQINTQAYPYGYPQALSAQVTFGQSCIPGTYCFYYPQQTVMLTPGQSTGFQGYTIMMTALTQTSATFVVSGGAAQVTASAITSLSASQGPVGTQLIINGSGFTNDNTVHFGSGAVSHYISASGNTISFTVPDTLTPSCYYSQPQCLTATQQTTPGVYGVSVSNVNGQSSTVNFTVTGGTQNTSITLSSPVAGVTYPQGQQMNIAWSSYNAPANSSVVLDLYQTNGNKVGTIAISGSASNSYLWSVPRVPNVYLCTMQYPNGLCGMALSGQYYLKAGLVAGTAFDANATVYASTNSGVFTIQ